jgi:hypothetical protein
MEVILIDQQEQYFQHDRSGHPNKPPVEGGVFLMSLHLFLLFIHVS